MGCYVNPQNETKEDFLKREGQPIDHGVIFNKEIIGWSSLVKKFDIPNTALPVILVDNGPFTAAGVAYSEDEYNSFIRPDGRFKIIFIVQKNKLYEVSELKEYETIH